MLQVFSFKVVCEMQEKLRVRSEPLFEESRQLPFRCPRCGERERFRSLLSLRAHLDYHHTYSTVHNLSLATRGRPVNVLLDHRKAQDASSTERCKSSSVVKCCSVDCLGRWNLKHTGVGLSLCPSNEVSEDLPDRGGATEPPSSRGVDTVPVQAQLRRRVEDMLRAADSSVERRLQQRVQSQHRVQQQRGPCEGERGPCERERGACERERGACEREKALSRQVDTAVIVIATLRGQLSESHLELERKEREIDSIHHFLEVAVQHETCGKLHLQNFIENILQRIASAETLLEYYQRASNQPNCTTHSVSPTAENGPQRMTKRRSAEQPVASAFPKSSTNRCRPEQQF
ncbi:protein ZNF365-like [Megalops cyprinoides]|uniref:protein ZNF365-like n=1 Tax=Megalops cyprinoides TaxID=118141 RepID=UPI001864609B|nr:protein ZNF365-like [Megalops cyprinoides]